MKKAMVVWAVCAGLTLVSCNDILPYNAFENEVHVVTTVGAFSLPLDSPGSYEYYTLVSMHITVRVQKAYQGRGVIQEVNLDFFSAGTKESSVFFNEGVDLNQASVVITAFGTAEYDYQHPYGMDRIKETLSQAEVLQLTGLQTANGPYPFSLSSGGFNVMLTAEAL